MQELNTAQFLSLLQRHSINIHARDGRLQISAPAGTVDPQLRAELTRRKTDLLEALRAAEVSTIHIPRLPLESHRRIPQTHAQQGLWLIDHFEPGNVAYNIPEAFSQNASVDLATLQKAVDALLARHESLRTFFYEEEGELFQSVSPDAKAQVGFTDLSVLEEHSRDQVLEHSIREHARLPFDLQHAPLVHFHLFRLNEQRHVVFFNIHHIVADGTSLNILREELAVLYQAVARNEPALLPDLPIQYADYAIWTAAQQDSEAMGRQIEYWKKKLAGVPPYVELWCSRPYPEQRTAWGATLPVAIPASLRDALNTVSREENTTRFMTLLAAFAVLVYKHSGSADFCIGSPFTHRKQVETEPLIGLFVNMLPFRCELSGESSFREFLRGIRNTALEAYDNSDVPFQELVRALKPDLRSRRSPIFQIMFGFEAATQPVLNGILPIDTKPGTARFDLTLQLSENSDGISGSLEYCTDLFDEASIMQLSKQYVAILDQVAHQPDRSIASIQVGPNLPPEPAALPHDPLPDNPNGSRSPIAKLTRWFSHRSRKN